MSTKKLIPYQDLLIDGSIQDATMLWSLNVWKHRMMPELPNQLLDGYTQDHRWLCFSDHRQFVMSAPDRKRSENAYAFPWANSCVYIPDLLISNQALIQHGFTIGWYKTRCGTYVRLAGIDGGGYNFDQQHFLPLMVQVNERLGNSIHTNKGWIEITIDDRDKLPMPKHCGPITHFANYLKLEPNGNLVEQWQDLTTTNNNGE